MAGFGSLGTRGEIQASRDVGWWKYSNHGLYKKGEAKMAKRQSESSAQGGRAAKSGKPIPDSQIDFSDIPESTDEELRRVRRVGRPKTGRPQRQLIALRIDPVLLKKLRDLAAKREKPYQTFIHELLERAAKRAA